MSTPATVAGARRQARWTREKIIERIQRWHALYEEPPRQADWNPSAARWSAAEWRIERYRLGDPETGEAWPSLNAAKRFFDGRFSDAVRAAGFEPHRPGPRRRPGAGLRPAVPQRAPAASVSATDALERELEAALTRADRAERKLAAGERRIAESLARAAAATERLSEARRARRLAVQRAERSRQTADRLRTRAQAAELALRAAGAAARAGAASGDRIAACEGAALGRAALVRAERAEASLAAVRGELDTATRRARADAKAAEAATVAREAAERDAAGAERRAVAAERRAAGALGRAEAAEDAARAAEARFGRLTRDAAAQELVAEARRTALAAEERAAIAERRMRELGALVTGEPRRLTAEEVERLRIEGPAGPAVMAEALTALARARRTNRSVVLAQALERVTVAAVNWKARL